jgi:hypothetical protein
MSRSASSRREISVSRVIPTRLVRLPDAAVRLVLRDDFLARLADFSGREPVLRFFPAIISLQKLRTTDEFGHDTGRHEPGQGAINIDERAFWACERGAKIRQRNHQP